MIIDFLQQFAQTNKGDTKGTVWATKNIDPNLNGGKINVTKPLVRNTTTDDQANLELPAVGFAFGDDTIDRYYAVADDRVWETAGVKSSGAWTEVSGTPTDCDMNSDIIAFNGKRYIATANNLVSHTQVAGFNNVDTLNATPHSFTIYANCLYVTDLHERIFSMNTSEALAKTEANTIDLNTFTGLNQEITRIKAVSDGIWIATLYSFGQGGEMIKWDGVTENVASARYQIPHGALSLEIIDDRPYIIDGKGVFRTFDGTSFKEVGRLPIKDEVVRGYNRSDNDDRFIHPNGMLRLDDELLVLISNNLDDATSTRIEQMPAGIWAWSPTLGVYHKYSPVDVAKSPSVTTPTPTDFGASEIVKAGALFRANHGQNLDDEDRSEILAGIKYYSDATTEKTGFFFLDHKNTILKGGYFVTAQAVAENFDEVWKEVIAVHDRFKNSTDRIVIKYRTHETDPIYGTGAWGEDTRITTTTDLSTLETGDEIEILRGKGSGACLTIDYISGTMVRFKENFLSGMSGTCKFRGQKWQEIGAQSNTDEMFIRRTLAGKGAWVQFKVFMVGTGRSPQIIKLISSSTPKAGYK